MKTCRVCEHPIEPFMTFGEMTVANAFINENDFENNSKVIEINSILRNQYFFRPY